MSRFLFASLLFTTTGCYKSWVELNPAVSIPEARPALLVSASIVVNHGEDQGLAGEMVAANDNHELAEVGPLVATEVGNWLAPRGFNLVIDEERAKSVQNIELGELLDAVAVLSGTWFDPRASTRALDNRTLNRRSYVQRLAEKLDDPAVEEAYVFIMATVAVKSPGFVMKRPALDLSVLVTDERGEDLVRARGWGFGDKDAMVMRTDAENLTVALNDAIAHLWSTPAGPTRVAKE